MTEAQAQAFVGQRVVMYNTGITRAQWMGGIVKGVGHDDKQVRTLLGQSYLCCRGAA